MNEFTTEFRKAPMRLSNENLKSLPDGIKGPSYDRTAITPGIVHIGLGNFHRAHQSWFLHRLMQLGGARDWGIIGAGVRPYDAEMRKTFLAQDCLTTLIELDPSGTSAEIVGPMIDYLPVEPGNAPLIAAMARPEIRIVALTVTEGGYFIDPVSGGFDSAHADIVHDADFPNAPVTTFGAIIAALKLRREKGVGPVTLQSCDNLQGNGRILRQTVVSLARLSDPELANWIEQHCSFPNSMVDCIVPATGPNEIALARSLGIEDPIAVTHENYRQWVIEDDFCAGRPDWDKVGVTFSDAVHDYEAMKIRLLNAGHQIIANAAEIMSVPTIADCMSNPLIAGLFQKVEHEEVAPCVPAIADLRPEDYIALVARRFGNTSIRDTTRRVAFDGSSRHPGFLLPVVRDRLDAGASVDGLALIEALWARMCAGTRDDGSTIEPNDPHWDDLTAAAQTARERPKAWLEQSRFYGDLVDKAAFANAFERWLNLLWANGCAATLTTYRDA